MDARSAGLRRLAVIDLGSNTARLVLLSYEPGRRYALLDELRQVVRLSEGMTEATGGLIRSDAFERGVQAMATFRAFCDAARVDDLCATATSAVRDAANGAAFLAAVKARTGLELRILSGEEEAYYGALAVINSSTLTDGFVLDIGGGSAQLSRVQERRVAAAASWPLGAVRMSERFFSDPPKKKEVRALVKHVTQSLGDAPEGFGEGAPLSGLGGTIRNLAKVQLAREAYPLDLLHGYALKEEALAEITELLLERSAAERSELPGLNADRADIIAAGATVALEILRRSGAGSIVISGQGLREGLFYPYLIPEALHLIEDVRAFSVSNLERHYYDHPAHNAHVAKLALALFDQLAELHGYGELERELLHAAARLHDIGMAVNYFDHHKHGFYLVMSGALLGFTHREQVLIALLVRYHRKGTPDAQGLEAVLAEGDMARAQKLGALLRLAEYLERSKAQRVTGLRCHLGDAYVQVQLLGDATEVERREAEGRKGLFEAAYGVTLELMSVGS
jgi:exopolyphosphatase/guanosine-5'-triphosphate,3'-diphosphate pyrophosphatase